ncbi:fungal specific transcription factor domain-containing protein [Magnaporthiopsis poae ATCC 64411]|uniref:Fungal specific transcription factor domain-containing protein n=1 Tax=Magnaporthiopsis poae (strain ATCC 64411 / 73-15) TaxID=644358 RepID=A0A0C4DYT3_MAGP6|nr:fungal specific transcription factor domain-containing protein [Magnaporthiopsis poae ATCC 64411]
MLGGLTVRPIPTRTIPPVSHNIEPDGDRFLLAPTAALVALIQPATPHSHLPGPAQPINIRHCRRPVFRLVSGSEELAWTGRSACVSAAEQESPDLHSQSGDLKPCARVAANGSSAGGSPGDTSRRSHADAYEAAAAAASTGGANGGHGSHSNGDGPSGLQRLVSKTAVPGASNPRYLGSTAGVSFARIVFAAVQSSVSDQKSSSDKGGVKPYRSSSASSSGQQPATSMRDSFFGLHTKPTIHPATFPDKQLGLRLVNLYFQHANPQIPVLHRGDFMEMFDRAYEEGRQRTPKEQYMLNMVFAIGGGIILADSKKSSTRSAPGETADGSKQSQPEEYHASAIIHLEACLSTSGGGLEELQAVLLLANFALLRPVPPGLWYIIGVAIRLAVDLGLHFEDGKDPQVGLEEGEGDGDEGQAGRERGRREYIRDLRRRLWWCTYSLDRLVSICVGRPFGISDQIITTEFPSLLEDEFITRNGFVEPPAERIEPSSKLVGEHYFRLRLLQSEILQVLQYQQAQLVRAQGQNRHNPYMLADLPSPFLARHNTFRSWRIDIDRRLYEWKRSAPRQERTGVDFSTDFLDLNYWQAIIMLYRQSLSVPAMFEGEYHISKEVGSPDVYSGELREDEDRVYLKVAEAGQKILRLYRALHVAGVVNYTYLATHHMFMAGISYLYAIWHSPIVRSRLTLDEVDFTILAANSVFTDLSDKCPPAESCRDAFDRTAKATIKMAASTGGFGAAAMAPARGHRHDHQHHSSRNSSEIANKGSDWAAQSESSASTRTQQMPHPRHSVEQGVPSVGFPALTSPPLQTHGNPPHFRIPGDIKADPDGVLMRPMAAPPPRPPRSTASGSEAAASPDPTVITDPGVVPSPTFVQQQPPPQQLQQQQQPQQQQRHPSVSPSGSAAVLVNSPGPATPRTAMSVGTLEGYQQQQQQQRRRHQHPQQVPQSAPPFTQGALNFAEVQNMEFIQGFAAAAPQDLIAAGIPAMNGVDTQMDLGLGIGWEGMHHDFSDGNQHVDLFDGFFFGGQQGGSGGGL